MHFHSRNCISKWHLRNGGHFASASTMVEWGSDIVSNGTENWKLWVVLMTTLSSRVALQVVIMATRKVVIMTTCSAIHDGKVVIIMTLGFQWICFLFFNKIDHIITEIYCAKYKLLATFPCRHLYGIRHYLDDWILLEWCCYLETIRSVNKQIGSLLWFFFFGILRTRFCVKLMLSH